VIEDIKSVRHTSFSPQGVLLNLLPARLFTRVSVYVQSGLIGAAFLAGLYSWTIRD
jgi:hypothetical protein